MADSRAEALRENLVENYAAGDALEHEGHRKFVAGTGEFLIGGLALTTLSLHMLTIAHPAFTVASLIVHSLAFGSTGFITIDGLRRMATGDSDATLGTAIKDAAMAVSEEKGITLFSRRHQAPAATNTQAPAPSLS